MEKNLRNVEPTFVGHCREKMDCSHPERPGTGLQDGIDTARPLGTPSSAGARTQELLRRQACLPEGGGGGGLGNSTLRVGPGGD